MTALIGRNGSGKSTLLKLLARQETPTNGTLRFGDAALPSFGARAFAREVAFLPQVCPPVPGMTVAELVSLGRYPWHGALGRVSDIDREAVAGAIRATGMEPYAGRDVESLSGGERQRAFVAMLIAQGSRCLLLDEPISALDVSHQIEVLSLLRSLSRARGLGLVVVIHDINLAARFFDRIVALRDGRVVAEGPPEDVVEPGCLKAIFGHGFATVPGPNGERLAFPL